VETNAYDKKECEGDDWLFCLTVTGSGILNVAPVDWFVD
jgi:hypothetical protein